MVDYHLALDLDRTHQLQLNNHQFQLLVMLLGQYGWHALNQMAAAQLLKLISVTDDTQEPLGELDAF